MICMSCYKSDRKVQSYLFENGYLQDIPVLRQLCEPCKTIVVNFLVREPGSSVDITNLSYKEADNELTDDEEQLIADQHYYGSYLQQLLS